MIDRVYPRRQLRLARQRHSRLPTFIRDDQRILVERATHGRYDLLRIVRWTFFVRVFLGTVTFFSTSRRIVAHGKRPLADASMPPNVWPARPEGFKEVFSELYRQFDATGATILSSIAVYLGLDEHWFDQPIEDGNSVMRLLHYPPLENVEGEAIRAGAHGDINLITLLLGAEEAGLELLTKEGNWIPANPPEGAMVINVGDMLERLTNHVLPSTIHRVRNPDPQRARFSRYSMPFFLHLRSDFAFHTLPQCISADNPDRYPVSITADEFLQQRLREIGLKK